MFWIPLLALAAAMASDEGEKPKYEVENPMSKTIFDIVSEGDSAKIFLPIIQRMAQEVQAGRMSSYKDAAQYLYQLGLGDPNSPEFAKTGVLLYCLAHAQPHKAIWVLEDEAYQALANTNPPWELVRDRLPRTPFPALLVRLPGTIPVYTREVPYPIEVGSILLVEEVPGQRWRYVGFNTANTIEKVAYTQGWFDVGSASAKAQLIEGQGIPDDGDYRLTGEDIVWQLLLNLMIALEHHHLDGRAVRPRRHPGTRSRKLKKRKSLDPYTVVRLSQASRDSAAAAQEKADATPSGRRPQRRHLRKGHWKTVWRIDPGDKPIYATKPRFDREGNELEGLLYKTATWVFPYWAGSPEGQPPGLYKVKL